MSCGCCNNHSSGSGSRYRSEESKLRRAFAEGFNKGVKAASQAALDLYGKSDRCFEDRDWETEEECDNNKRDEECGNRHRNRPCHRCCK